MAAIRRSFRWSSEKKKTLTIAVPKSTSGFGFTVAWTKPPLVDFISEGGTAEKAGLMPGDKIVSIDKIPVSKKGKEEIENIVKNVKEIMELEITRPEGELATRKRQTSLRRKESFTKKGSRMVIQDAQIMLWRRERALLKLLLCEEDLLNAIQDGKEHFMIPLRKQCSLTTSVELEILFSNMEEIGTVHERQVQQLRLLTQGTEDCIGRLYQKQVDERLSILRKYVSSLQLGRILYTYKMLNKPFREFIETLKGPEENLDLLQFIEKPFKYISDITAQLAALLSCTAVGHKDYVCLESIVSIYRSFESEMGEVMNKLSDFEDMEGAENSFDGEEPFPNLEVLQEKTLFTKGPRDFPLIHPGRYWLFSGHLSKVDGKHYVQYWGLLLSDCLIIARRTEQGVLLVLDEPVMLRSIYQATFDIKNCDTEFRILYALEFQNVHKSAGQRNQWATWIFRTPCPGIKLIWQTILTYQLSLFTIEALGSGKASFVHPRQSLVFRGVLPKRNSKYGESSYVTLNSGPPVSFKYVSGPRYAAATNEKQNEGFEDNFQEVGNNAAKNNSIPTGGLIPIKVEKEGSYFSLNEGVQRKGKKKTGVVRSKSFGNDFSDSIPFIDCVEDYLAPGPNVLYVRETGITDDIDDPPTSSSPTTPKTTTTDKTVQTTGGDGVSPKRTTPKKKFPRLGTFERIKMENRKSPEKTTTTTPPRTGTSDRHRRPPVVSGKEELRSSECDQFEVEGEKPSPRRRGFFFSRFWKKNSKFSSSLNAEMMEEARQEAKEKEEEGVVVQETTLTTAAADDSQGVLAAETENNNGAKWTLSAMERYMRDQSEGSVALGLLPTTTGGSAAVRRPPDDASEESSPSWASSSAGDTPSFSSGGQAFEFGAPPPPTPPVITTTACSDDLSAALDKGLQLSLCKPRRSRKDSSDGATASSQGGTPTKIGSSKLSRLLRRTHSAGCSKDVPCHSQFVKTKAPVTKTKSADSAPCCREDGDEKQKKNRKTLAQDMKMRLSFLRRRHTDSSLQPSSVRPSPEEAHKWAESFQELTNSKYGLTLFRAFLSREFSEENIEFWLACEDYKRTRPNKLPSKARKIYEDFVAVQAPKEVNLDSSMRSAIHGYLQNPDRHSFDSAQRRIQGLMEQDAYVRFLQSELYTDLATQANSPNTSS